jgi:hypothetical protein
VRSPGNYDALRQAEQQAQEARDATPRSEATAQLDSAQEAPTRPTGHAATSAQYTDGGEPVVPVKAKDNWAKQIAEEAKERADAIAQSKGKDDRER